MQDLKPQRAIEADSSWHLVGAQCDRADPVDHGQPSSCRITFVLATYFRVTVDHLATSALHSLADIVLLSCNVGEGPEADINLPDLRFCRAWSRLAGSQ